MRRSARDDAPMSWTARVLAPLALLVAVVAIFLVISSTLEDSPQPARQAGTQDQGCEPDAQNAVEDGYYVLEAGEDLSVVSAKTCIDTEELEALNPDLDPQQLPVGGCVDLVADGCKVLAQD